MKWKAVTTHKSTKICLKSFVAEGIREMGAVAGWGHLIKKRFYF